MCVGAGDFISYGVLDSSPWNDFVQIRLVFSYNIYGLCQAYDMTEITFYASQETYSCRSTLDKSETMYRHQEIFEPTSYCIV